MKPFSKPSRKPREEPEGLDAFAASMPSTVVHLVQSSAPESPREPEPDPESEPDLHGMNVRFNPTEKAALVKLARHERRSQHQMIKLLLVPALFDAVRAIDATLPVP